MQQPFESWSLSSPPVPPRSQLYSLQPVGVGTALVESLTGYVARLAEAHSVSVGDLVGRLLSDLANPKGGSSPPVAKAARVGGHGFRACSYAINGVTDRAATWVDALEAATTRRDLRCLTLLPFRYALPDHLFRRRRAWCMLCFEQWRANGQIVYEPLLWAIACHHIAPSTPDRSIAFAATVHVASAHSACSPGRDTASSATVGWARRMLTANRRTPVRRPRRRPDVVEHPGRRFAGDASGGRPSGCPGIVSPKPDRVSRRGRRRQCPCPGRAHSVPTQHSPELAGWCALPRLENLLRTCSIPECSGFELLFAPSGPTPTNIVAAKEAFALSRKSLLYRHPGMRAKFGKLFWRLLMSRAAQRDRRLREVWATQTPRASIKPTERSATKSLPDIDSRAEVIGGRSLEQPEFAKTLAEGNLGAVAQLDRPTSVHQIAVSLGYPNGGYVHQKFPELCRAIGEKIVLAKQDVSKVCAGPWKRAPRTSTHQPLRI